MEMSSAFFALIFIHDFPAGTMVHGIKAQRPISNSTILDQLAQVVNSQPFITPPLLFYFFLCRVRCG